jgi:hypothetical protein
MFDEKLYRKEYYKKNKEKILARQKETQKERYPAKKARQTKYYGTKDGRITRYLHAARKRAKQKELEFDLDLKFLRDTAPDICPVFKIKLDWSSWGKTNGIATDNSPSLDKIDPNGGYTKDNVIWLSWRANRLKSDATYEELLILAKWLKEFKEKKLYDNQQTNRTTSDIAECTDRIEEDT